jgi:hypothetical protein
MRRRLLIAFFALGTLGGYGSAIATSSCHARRQGGWDRPFSHPCGGAARRHAAPQDDPADDR